MVVLKGFIAVILSILVVFIAPAYAQNQTQTQPQTPQMQPSFELSNNVSTLLRAIMTEELSDVDRSVLISELEQAIQSFLTDTVNVEFDTRDGGNERVITITTARALAETPEEQPGEDTDNEDQEGNDDDNDISSNNNRADNGTFFDGANMTFLE
jgi:biopolymer transport protein ExbD